MTTNKIFAPEITKEHLQEMGLVLRGDHLQMGDQLGWKFEDILAIESFIDLLEVLKAAQNHYKYCDGRLKFKEKVLRFDCDLCLAIEKINETHGTAKGEG